MIDTVPITTTRMRAVVAGGSPGTGIVALVTRRTTEQTGVESRIGVTGSTSRGQGCEYVINMTLRAGQPGMCTGQRKARERVIERSRQPAVRAMTGIATSAESTFVGIIFCMT